MNTNTVYDLMVVGGGASGMMAAGKAASLGKKVLLIEKNKTLGEKLKITGGGRCNITNATYDTREMLSNYGDASKFLFSSFSEFGVKETFTFFEGLGLPLVVEARNRAFPKTEKASDVVKVFIKHMKDSGVNILTATKVNKILRDGDRITGVVCDKGTYTADSYILATGGVSHPETGSTGDGFSWLTDLGHKVVSPTPTIVPLKTSNEWGHVISGISMIDVKITFFVNNKKKFSEKGKILFTHFGLSGPLILNLAYKVADLLQEGEVRAMIDMYPSQDTGLLDKKITAIFNENKNKDLKNVLREIVQDGCTLGVKALLGDMDMDKKVNNISYEERRKIVDTLKSLPINIVGLMGLDRAVVADGGIPLSEVDTKTMRSKIISNLFIAGDLLHVNRPSGGYSLQLCWTTGWVAGLNA